MQVCGFTPRFLIFQPVDLFPRFTIFGRLTFVIAALTLLVFAATQINVERRLSAWTRETAFVVALCGAAIVSIAWSVSPGASTETFQDSFLKAVLMFFVMINAVRTQKRLMWLLLLVLTAGAYLSFGALNAFRLGQFSVEGYRVRGSLTGALLDPNDSALFLVMMIPVAVALLLSSRNRLAQCGYALVSLLMLGAIFVTYSRGGFLALACGGGFMTWKLFQRSPVRTSVVIVLGLVAGIAVLPSNYSSRLASIIDPDLDPHATSSARHNLLDRSIQVASDHPIVGVGMGNFHLFSIRNQVSHNAYTQIAAEMGFPAMLIYIGLILSPLSRLRRIERETRGVSQTHEGYRRIHFLAIALQASVFGFMVGSFFLSVAYYWFLYYLVGYAVCVGRLYETELGRVVGTYEFKEIA